jgi:hypothetical protein
MATPNKKGQKPKEIVEPVADKEPEVEQEDERDLEHKAQMAAILEAMSEMQEEMKEMKKERSPRKQSPEPKKNQTKTPRREKDISRNSNQYLAKGLEDESGEDEKSSSGEENETSEDEEEAKSKRKKKINRKSAEKSRERHRAKEQEDWLRRESHVPATRRNLEEGKKNSKVPNLTGENSDDEVEKKNRPSEKGVKVPDLKEFFGSLILSRHPDAWNFLQWSNRVVIFRDLSARHLTEIETNFYQIIDPNILPWLVEENYKDSEQVDTNLNSWRDGVQSGLVFSRVIGAKQGEEFGPKPGYVLDNHTKISQLKFRPLVLLLNYIITPKNVVEFHTTLYSLIHNRFPAPKKAGLQGFLKTDVQNMRLQYPKISLFLQEFLSMYQTVWGWVDKMEDDFEMEAVRPAYLGAQGLQVTALRILDELGCKHIQDLLADIKNREQAMGLDFDQPGGAMSHKAWDLKKSQKKAKACVIATLSELLNELIFQTQKLYSESRALKKMERPANLPDGTALDAVLTKIRSDKTLTEINSLEEGEQDYEEVVLEEIDNLLSGLYQEPPAVNDSNIKTFYSNFLRR